MKNTPFRIGFVVVAVIVAIAWWLVYQPEEQSQQLTIPPVTVKPPKEAVIKHPVTAAPKDIETAKPLIPPEQPLPQLKESDAPMAEILAKLFTDENLGSFFILEHFIERFVVMVDNLPRQELPKSHRPIKQIPGSFLALGGRSQLSIDPANYQRYSPLVKMLSTLETKQVVAVYKRLYPLFQEAYEGLGYPDAYFNDRLIEVIDHLLTTPPATGQVYLEQPKVLYLYADEKLEKLSAGRKILIRSGPKNTAQVKTLLHAYRQELVSGT